MKTVYEYTNYKIAVKERLKALKKDKPRFSLRSLAVHLSLQYTFLSKVLNSTEHHLNDDQIFQAGKFLGYLPDEIDYLLLLRAFNSTQNADRKKMIFQRISNIQKQKKISVNLVSAQSHHFEDDMKYMMDYNVILIHVSLWIKEVQKNPYVLCRLLGLDRAKVKAYLELLERLGQIQYDAENDRVLKVQNHRPHFGKDHPLTRTHQLVLKTFLNQLSFSRPEDKKENLFFTFTTDAVGFESIKSQIKNFAADLQKTSFAGQHTGVYQLNIDFLEVFSLDF